MSTSRTLSCSGITLAVALASLGLSGRVQAADYLRGAYAGDQEPRSAGVDWAGVYGGVHAGMSVGQTDPRAMAAPLARTALPSTVITDAVARAINFKATNKSAMSYGGFVGMNWLWDDVVLGIEADYTRSNIAANSSSTDRRIFRDTGTSTEYDITTNSTSRARIRDWATLRGRVGWAAGMFMPYLTAGVAFGNVDGRATVSGSWDRYDVSALPARPLISSGVFNGVIGRRGITYGAAYGAGIDMQLFPGMFMRAEWQHIALASGGQRPEVSINTARIAGGVKF